jgi:O-antigen/teichoic acid export membrane protein
LTPPFQVRAKNDKRHQQEKMMRSIFRNLLVSILFLLIVLGWFGDSLLSVLIGRPKLSFREVYESWKNHLLRQRLAENGSSYRLG